MPVYFEHQFPNWFYPELMKFPHELETRFREATKTPYKYGKTPTEFNITYSATFDLEMSSISLSEINDFSAQKISEIRQSFGYIHNHLDNAKVEIEIRTIAIDSDIYNLEMKIDFLNPNPNFESDKKKYDDWIKEYDERFLKWKDTEFKKWKNLYLELEQKQKDETDRKVYLELKKKFEK